MLAEEQVTAPAKEKVLEVLGGVAVKLRRELGESLASMQKYDVPLEQATTLSLEAVKSYSLGQKIAAETRFGAQPYFLRAVELDPNFVRAHAALANEYNNHNEAELARQSAQRAYELRDRCTESEKLRIEALYDEAMTGDLQKSAAVYKLCAQTYPHDSTAAINLCATYWCWGYTTSAWP